MSAIAFERVLGVLMLECALVCIGLIWVECKLEAEREQRLTEHLAQLERATWGDR